MHLAGRLDPKFNCLRRATISVRMVAVLKDQCHSVHSSELGDGLADRDVATTADFFMLSFVRARF